MLTRLATESKVQRAERWIAPLLALAGVLLCGASVPLKCLLCSALVTLVWRSERHVSLRHTVLIVHEQPWWAGERRRAWQAFHGNTGRGFACGETGHAGAWGLSLNMAAAPPGYSDTVLMRSGTVQPAVARRLARRLLHRRSLPARRQAAARDATGFRYNRSLPRISHPPCPLP